MCGIVGAIYGKNGPEADGWTATEAAQLLLESSVHRGEDATGWMFPDADVEVRKFPLPAPLISDAIDIPTESPWWFGHVRFATRGTPKYNGNNHPIKHGDIVGIHNGTIYNDDAILAVTGREDPAAEVDSEAIFAAVHHLGVKKGLRAVTGGAAVAFVDRTNLNRVYLSRIRSYPLVIAKSPAGNFYFASQLTILNQLEIKWEKTWTVKEGRLIVFENGKIRSFKQFMPETKKAKAKPKMRQGKTRSWDSIRTEAAYTKSYDAETGYTSYTYPGVREEPEFDSMLEWAQYMATHASDKVEKMYDGELMTEREYYTRMIDEFLMDQPEPEFLDFVGEGEMEYAGLDAAIRRDDS